MRMRYNGDPRRNTYRRGSQASSSGSSKKSSPKGGYSPVVSMDEECLLKRFEGSSDRVNVSGWHSFSLDRGGRVSKARRALRFGGCRVGK